MTFLRGMGAALAAFAFTFLILGSIAVPALCLTLYPGAPPLWLQIVVWVLTCGIAGGWAATAGERR